VNWNLAFTPKLELENVKDALQALFAKERDGRILLNIA
jgi:hypothetical protein